MTADKTPLALNSDTVEHEMRYVSIRGSFLLVLILLNSLSSESRSEDGRNTADQLIGRDKSDRSEPVDRDSQIRTRSSNGM